MDDLQLAQLDRQLDLVLSAETVTPREREKLKGLLAYYAKKKHPFTACVRDNTKRWGLELAKKRCAVLKDLIVGNKNWRKGRQAANMSEGTTEALLEEILQDDSFREYLLSWHE